MRDLEPAASSDSTVDDHPVWCARPPSGCPNGWHTSADVIVPGDEIAGVAVRTALSGRRERLFVELEFTPLPDNAVSLDIAYAIAGAIKARQHADDNSVTQRSGQFVYQHPDDPIYVTDPHEHDLTIEQARLLYQALGELLTQAKGRLTA
jgi:hypothetical protein